MSTPEATRLRLAYEKARYDLLRERVPAGHWVGELSTSALSTATAVSALSLVERHSQAGRELNPSASRSSASGARSDDLARHILGGIHWLADHQNADGGWGDTDLSHSNIATSMLAAAAFHLTGVPARHADLLDRAEQYIATAGGIPGLRKRYGRDKTFAVPILTNCALAGMTAWSEVSPLPFELACVPQKFYRFLQLPVVSYAIPALVAVGQARYFHRPPLNPLVRVIRKLAISKSLSVLGRMQPSSGGYLEAVPLTSFVIMSLASTGRADHPVVRRGVEFLLSSVRPDGSWPIDTNLATWNTTLCSNALAAGGDELEELAPLDWLLGCQWRVEHPFTGASPGGWGWSDLSGAVPDADDTPGALLALTEINRSTPRRSKREQAIEDAARAGCDWLLDLQNRDGGWPTFCRGWGKLPFDRSGADLTAHALRALHAWRHLVDGPRLNAAVRGGLVYLAAAQRKDGSWIPLWFGNQDQEGEENPVYGTSKVLMAYRDLHASATPEAERGFMWLASSQNPDGGWGGGPSLAAGPSAAPHVSSVEETALATEALLSKWGDPHYESAIRRGISWLVEAVESDRHLKCASIGFYFAKLWYYERLYPLIFTASALGQAHRRLPAWPAKESATVQVTC